jgi:hypothetical protein
LPDNAEQLHSGINAMGQSLPDLNSRIVALESLMSRTRHDIRSALAPAMLAADMLRGSTDPKAQRSGATVVRSIERVLGMLDSTREIVPSRVDLPRPVPDAVGGPPRV